MEHRIRTVVAVLCVAAGAGCNEEGYGWYWDVTTDGTPDSTGDTALDTTSDPVDDTGTDPVCPGYTGADTYCCQVGDPCSHASNSSCDCDDTCTWDSVDCGGPVCDCSEFSYQCNGTDLDMCDDGCNWTLHDCDAECASDGYDYSLGCSYSWVVGHDDCECESEDCACSSGEQACNGTDLDMCDDGCDWTLHDCDTECTMDGYDLSLGCAYDSILGTDACQCDNEGCDCASDEQECDTDGLGLNMCDDGCNWTYHDCYDECYDAGYTGFDYCGYYSSYGVDVCFCL